MWFNVQFICGLIYDLSIWKLPNSLERPHSVRSDATISICTRQRREQSLVDIPSIPRYVTNECSANCAEHLQRGRHSNSVSRLLVRPIGPSMQPLFRYSSTPFLTTVNPHSSLHATSGCRAVRDPIIAPVPVWWLWMLSKVDISSLPSSSKTACRMCQAQDHTSTDLGLSTSIRASECAVPL